MLSNSNDWIQNECIRLSIKNIYKLMIKLLFKIIIRK